VDHGANVLPISSDKIKNMHSYTTTSTCLHGMVLHKLSPGILSLPVPFNFYIFFWHDAQLC
jgi:hypothetical protein